MSTRNGPHWGGDKPHNSPGRPSPLSDLCPHRAVHTATYHICGRPPPPGLAQAFHPVLDDFLRGLPDEAHPRHAWQGGLTPGHEAIAIPPGPCLDGTDPASLECTWGGGRSQPPAQSCVRAWGRTSPACETCVVGSHNHSQPHFLGWRPCSVGRPGSGASAESKEKAGAFQL